MYSFSYFYVLSGPRIAEDNPSCELELNLPDEDKCKQSLFLGDYQSSYVTL